MGEAEWSVCVVGRSGPRTVCPYAWTVRELIRSGTIIPSFVCVYPSKLVDSIGERLGTGPNLPLYEGVRHIVGLL
jgi:hypothetical protein